jgi:DNA-binding response OmpR family regulator
MMAELPPARLLIVDDEEPLREVFRIFMEKAGFIVDEAEDGVAGLERAKLARPDLIVLDLMMPRLSGFDVLHRLAETSLKEVPVIVITGFSNVANEELIKQERAVIAFLKKPIVYAELVKTIKKALGR